ncbi:MAG: type VI secretion system baseplate subunit TssF [Phreatobacter sp.]|uniref:type VI secretion system baseplate subunit TssF n=1 Tax=Phreatobacter sp. TaxID=1966341 RepID=UPI002734E839|nr:type VI secretion system baseplate subunit TssF [Phreatobacter sp.]MDP2800825.1 type VI secretion system baseplate subunit TssF [Phreatobacter sp.]
MALNPFYEDELSYLREQGAEFAHANPNLAPFLAREAQDPDVERLLEGFAFLVARLRQRMEQETPNVLQGLIRLIWPQFLRPVPPMTMLAFSAADDSIQTCVQLPKGAVMRARPIEGIECPFVTAYPVDVVPFSMTAATMDNRATSARLTLSLTANGRATSAALPEDRLRLFFNAEREPFVPRALVLWLLRHVRSVRVTSETGQSLELGPDAFRPVGYDDAEALLPAPPTMFAGFRLIQEYHAFPAKFLFADLLGLAPVRAWQARNLTLTIELGRPFPDQVRITDGLVRLNCTPAYNLTEVEGQPIRISGAKTEYRLMPVQAPYHSIHAVERVSGYLQGRPGRQDYVAFEGFRHDLPGDPSERVFYREQLRPAVVGRGVEHFLSFVNRRDLTLAPSAEVISTRLIASNAPIADRIGVGMVDVRSPDVPATVRATNISTVTAEIPPPLADGLLWRLICSLGRNFGSLTDVRSLRDVVASYDFRAVHDTQARRRLELLLEGLVEISSVPGDAILRGVPARMRRMNLTIAESKVGGEPELYLLGSVLDAFFSAYANVNALHRLEVRGAETNVSYGWAMRAGAALPL